MSIGKIFENFAEDFLTKVNGFYSRGSGRVSYSLHTGRKEHDYDLIIHNKSLLFPELGNYLIVECKFHQDKIGYEDLSKFFHKLHTKRCSTGILFTMEGVKHGNKNTTLREIYDNDGISILVFDKNDIEAVISGKENLATMIRVKYEQVRFRIN